MLLPSFVQEYKIVNIFFACYFVVKLFFLFCKVNIFVKFCKHSDWWFEYYIAACDILSFERKIVVMDLTHHWGIKIFFIHKLLVAQAQYTIYYALENF